MLILITKGEAWISGHESLEAAADFMKEMKEQYESEVLTAHVVQFKAELEGSGYVLSAMADTRFTTPDSIGKALQKLVDQAYQLGKAHR